MTTIKIYNKAYTFAKSVNAGFDDKQKRAVKLAAKFEILDKKFDGMIERGGYVSDTARCALACKLMMHTGIRIGNESSSEGYMTKPHPNSKKQAEFAKQPAPTTKRAYNSEVREVCEYVAEKLNNTPSVCKKSYIDGDMWCIFENERLNR